jgi:hypothetical protein
MDPYLEGELWTTVHSQLAAEIARQLAPKIAPRYIARTEKRFVVAAPEDIEDAEIAIYTDVGVRTARAPAKGKRPASAAVLEAPLVLPSIIREEMPHYWVEIRDAKRRKRVTAIEILSPFNKRGRGRVDYLEKRDAILKSPAHFLEIDLLRRGQRPPMRRKLPAAEYFVRLDLQDALTQVYDTLRYDLEIDYSRPPDVALTRRQAALAAKYIRAARKEPS